MNAVVASGGARSSARLALIQPAVQSSLEAVIRIVRAEQRRVCRLLTQLVLCLSAARKRPILQLAFAGLAGEDAC